MLAHILAALAGSVVGIFVCSPTVGLLLAAGVSLHVLPKWMAGEDVSFDEETRHMTVVVAAGQLAVAHATALAARRRPGRGGLASWRKSRAQFFGVMAMLSVVHGPRRFEPAHLFGAGACGLVAAAVALGLVGRTRVFNNLFLVLVPAAVLAAVAAMVCP